MRNKLKYFTGILFGSLLILLGSAATFSEFKTGNYKQKLSEYGFFMGDMANLQPGADLIPYDLNTPLFSDYTLKSRFIRLPEGQQANYHPEAVFDFPIGTAIIKTFY